MSRIKLHESVVTEVLRVKTREMPLDENNQVGNNTRRQTD